MTALELSSTQHEEDGVQPFSQSSINSSTSWVVYCGDSREILVRLQPNSVNCAVTSPPYFWQRDYGVAGQIGMEQSIDEYVQNIVRVFRGIKHVLRSDGVVFLNLGDTYYSAKGKPHGNDSKHTARHMARRALRAVDGPGLGLPRKSLIGIPWRVALALANDEWTLRSDIIWVRRTALPEPTAADRPWRHHEHIFLFSKKPRYFFNRSAVLEEEDVWEIEPDRDKSARGQHYAPFPSALVKRCIQAGCPEGGTVLDPFAGGGTTLAVAQEKGLHSIGVDLNPDYCTLITRRLAPLRLFEENSTEE